ncbi:CoA transferase [Brevibacterium yomogidense]|uniref:CoA transferase n=1 Tax=Brevibacterium yomogidense TaxID=946573 RepID=UPI0018DF222B|nr:CoA transferase [Brevibacterium yomogidense]
MWQAGNTTGTEAHNSSFALDGIVAVDLTTSVAGQYTGRLLAMNGAKVVLVEPPEGSPMRTRGRPVPEGGETFLFRHLNQGKRSISLDLDLMAHAATLNDLLSRADVILRDEQSYIRSTSDLRSSVIECVVAEAPRDGEYSEWSFDEMSHQALSGVMNMTGVSDREPIYGVGERASYAAGTTAYISVVSALYERRTSNQGQRVDATVFESIAAMGQNLVSQFSYNGTAESRARYPGFLALLRCADAWVVLFVIRNWPTLCDVFELPELLTDRRYRTSGDRLERWPEIVSIVQEKSLTLRADDVVEACQRGRVSAEKVVGLDELINSDQWQVRRVLGTASAAAGAASQTTVRRLFDFSAAKSEINTASPPLAPAGVGSMFSEVFQ